MTHRYNQIMRLLVLVLGISLVLPAQGQSRKQRQPDRTPAAESAADSRTWPIRALRVEGNQNYTEEQVLSVAGLRVGQRVTKESFDQARDRLLASGAFENVGYSYQPAASGTGYSVVLTVQEVQPVYPVSFEDLPATREELEAELRRNDILFGPKIPASEALLTRYSQILQEFLAAKGFKEKVIGRVTIQGTDDLSVVFRPNTVPPSITEVQFLNARVVHPTDLKKAVHSTAIGAVYQEARFRKILDYTIRPLYEERGYLGVSFPKIAIEPAKGTKGVIVTVTVDEGPVYSLGDVKVEGVPLTKEQIESIAKFRPEEEGAPVNFRIIQEGTERLLIGLRRQGYIKAAANTERKIDEEKKKADLVIRVDPGPQFLFGTLKIDGLDIHGEAAIKKLWALKAGKPFDAGYPDYFLNRVRQDGIFDNLGKTRAEIVPDEKSLAVDVILHFQ